MTWRVRQLEQLCLGGGGMRLLSLTSIMARELSLEPGPDRFFKGPPTVAHLSQPAKLYFLQVP